MALENASPLGDEEPIKFAVAQTLLLSPPRPRHLDATILFGLTKDMVGGGPFNLFDVTVQTAEGGLIGYNSSDGEPWGSNAGGDNDQPLPKPNSAGEAWPGKGWYLEEFASRGVTTNRLVPIGPGYHTRHEVQLLISTAQAHGWGHVCIVTTPWYIPIALCLAVVELRKLDRRLSIFAVTSPHTNWYGPLVGSQGQSTTTAELETGASFRKLLRYQQAGVACSLDALFEYLRNRDSQ